MTRIAPRVRTLLGCTAAAFVLAACGSTPDALTAPDLRTLPSTIPTVPPPTSGPPTSAPPAPLTSATPSPTGKPKPAVAAPGRRSVRAGNPGIAPTVGAGVGFIPIGGDEFNGSLNTGKWGLYDSKGGLGYGLRRPSAISQAGGLLTITAKGDVSGGMSDSFGQTYGRWEYRARTDDGRGFGSAILLWPDSEKLIDGEIDISEVPFERRDLAHFILHSGPGGDTMNGSQLAGDFSQWHTFAVDWLPDHITWYVDGVARFTVRDKTRIPDTPMHLAIQLDEGPAKDWILAPDATTPPQIRLQVDWVHVYRWAGAPAPATAAASSSATSTKPSKPAKPNND